MKLFAQITRPENGYLPDREASQRHIEQNGAPYLYEVERVDIGRSSTEVWLKDISWKFNSVNLSFFMSEGGKQVKAYDIFKDLNKLPQINYTYINMLSL